MQTLTNVTGISLPLAVWLASDGYDFVPGSKSISATSLLKPVRQILLRERLTDENSLTPDVSDYIASRLGHSIHDGIERSWTKDYKAALKRLGYPQQLIDRVKVNPSEELEDDDIPVWLEQRGSRKIRGYTISGKFDQVLEGELQDFKSTSVYSWIKGSKDEDYSKQGSLYRWIHQDKVTSDVLNIQFIFTDWQRGMARSDPNYPQQRVMEHKVQLMSLEETERWIHRQLDHLEAHAELPEDELPRCTDKDLWRGETVWKYYSNPQKTDGRATKNFTSAASANAHLSDKAKGVVIEVPGQVKACSYCPAFPICTQKDEYEHG